MADCNEAVPAVKHVAGPHEIHTRAGHNFDLGAVSGVVDINDVAHALAAICRFNGHTGKFYSVAEHCVHASRIVAPEFALEALLHDVAEAYIGDVAAPLKSLLPDFRALETRLEHAIRAAMGLPLELSPEVRAADMAMLAAEKRQAMACDDVWPGLEDVLEPPVTLEFWPPDTARQNFLIRFCELKAGDFEFEWVLASGAAAPRAIPRPPDKGEARRREGVAQTPDGHAADGPQGGPSRATREASPERLP